MQTQALKAGKNRIQSILCPFLAIWSILVVFYFICIEMRHYFNSDYADTLFWTDSMFQSHALFDKNFSYPCLIPLGGQWLYAPFYLFFGVSLKTCIGGMCLFTAIFIASLIFLFRSLKFNWNWTFFGIFAVLSVFCSSVKMREIYYGHVLYYSLGSLFLSVGLALLLKTDQNFKKKAWVRWACLLSLFILITSVNGTYTIALFILPVFLGLLLADLLDEKTTFLEGRGLSHLVLLLCALVFTAGGFVFNLLLTRNFSAEYAEAFSSFAADKNFGSNLTAFFPQYVTLFTDNVYYLTPLVSFNGIFIAFRILLSALLVLLPVIALVNYKKFNKGEQILIFAHAIQTALLLFVFIFGFLSNANWRLTPMVFTSVLVSIVTLRKFYNKTIVSKRMVLCVLCLFSLIGLWNLSNTYTLPNPSNNSDTHSSEELAEILEQNNLTYGYADFWDSHVITVLTNNRIKVRPIEVSEYGTIRRRDYQSRQSWYEGQGKGEQYFLLLDKDAYYLLPEDTQEQFVDVIDLDDYYICLLKEDYFPLKKP